MSLLQAEVYEAFQSIDMPDDKAPKAAVALSAALTKVEDETIKGFNKRDADINTIRRDVQSLKIATAVMERILGILIAMNVAVLFIVFAH